MKGFLCEIKQNPNLIKLINYSLLILFENIKLNKFVTFWQCITKRIYKYMYRMYTSNSFRAVFSFCKSVSLALDKRNLFNFSVLLLFPISKFIECWIGVEDLFLVIFIDWNQLHNYFNKCQLLYTQNHTICGLKLMLLYYGC